MLRDAQKFRIKQFLYNPRHGFVREDPDDNKEIDFLSKFLKYCNYVLTFQELRDVMENGKYYFIFTFRKESESEQVFVKSKRLKSAEIIIIMPTGFT